MKIRKIFLLTFAIVMPLWAQAQDAAATDDQTADSTNVAGASILTFPNAFSPNDDDINDTYEPIRCENIEEFHAYIFNRWGQKLYEWTDPNGGWDGTHNGKPVKQGTYFVLVKARGADGQTFNIKKDVNLLRGFTDTTTVTE